MPDDREIVYIGTTPVAVYKRSQMPAGGGVVQSYYDVTTLPEWSPDRITAVNPDRSVAIESVRERAERRDPFLRFYSALNRGIDA